MAVTRYEMVLRLRRLIDDVGSAYSQSAPGYVTNILDLQPPAPVPPIVPTIGIYIDDMEDPVDVVLAPLESLTSGQAIAAAIQRGIRAADPVLLRQGFTNCVCTFHRADGYVLRGGTYGSRSEVHVVPATTGFDVSEHLKLGLANGGYESESHLDFSDYELEAIIDDALAVQNNVGEKTSWDYDTLPPEFQTVVSYRGWATVVDTKLGRSANYYPQKVALEETSANVIFENFYKLARWLRDRIEEMVNGLESQVETYSIVRWDRELQVFVGDKAYYDSNNRARVNAVLPGMNYGEVVLEFEQLLTTDAKYVYVAYSQSSPVWDPTKLTETSFSDPGFSRVAGLATDSTLVRELKGAKNNLVKITGLTPGETYFFATQVTDQNGNRYFSNEVSLTLPEEE